MPIPVVLCFDVEPDEREVGLDSRAWLGFERLVDRVKRLREELMAVTGRPVHFNWFLRMDPQIADSHGQAGWVADRYGDQLRELRDAGDGIGLHPHCWRWSPNRARWVTEHGDAEWVDHCIRLSFETYDAVFGEACRIVRFGDRFMSARALWLAAELGARFDLTVEPGMPGVRSLARGSLATGRIPSHAGAPREPYLASMTDPIRRAEPASAADTADMWMMPLTAIDPDPSVPLWRRLGRRVKHPRSPRYRTATLLLPARPQAFCSLIERDLGSTPRPHLAFATRTDIFVRPSFNAAFKEKILALRGWPPARRLSFATPGDALAALEANARET